MEASVYHRDGRFDGEAAAAAARRAPRSRPSSPPALSARPAPPALRVGISPPPALGDRVCRASGRGSGRPAAEVPSPEVAPRDSRAWRALPGPSAHRAGRRSLRAAPSRGPLRLRTSARVPGSLSANRGGDETHGFAPTAACAPAVRPCGAAAGRAPRPRAPALAHAPPQRHAPPRPRARGAPAVRPRPTIHVRPLACKVEAPRLPP
jgi:hypothetical protein